MTDRFPELPRIEVPADVADAAQMPDDLDANVFGPYTVPDTARRRRAGIVYAAAAAITVAAVAVGLPRGMLVMAAALVLIAAYHWWTGRRLEVREHQALTEATRIVTFPIGHASATVGFEGVTARPVWNVLVFSADEPPTMRGLVRVDGRSGAVVGTYQEPIPPEPAPDLNGSR